MANYDSARVSGTPLRDGDALKAYFENKDKSKWSLMGKDRLVIVKDENGKEHLEIHKLKPYQRVQALWGRGDASFKNIIAFCANKGLSHEKLNTKIQKYNAEHGKAKQIDNASKSIVNPELQNILDSLENALKLQDKDRLEKIAEALSKIKFKASELDIPMKEVCNKKREDVAHIVHRIVKSENFEEDEIKKILVYLQFEGIVDRTEKNIIKDTPPESSRVVSQRAANKIQHAAEDILIPKGALTAFEKAGNSGNPVKILQELKKLKKVYGDELLSVKNKNGENIKEILSRWFEVEKKISYFDFTQILIGLEIEGFSLTMKAKDKSFLNQENLSALAQMLLYVDEKSFQELSKQLLTAILEKGDDGKRVKTPFIHRLVRDQNIPEQVKIDFLKALQKKDPFLVSELIKMKDSNRVDIITELGENHLQKSLSELSPEQKMQYHSILENPPLLDFLNKIKEDEEGP